MKSDLLACHRLIPTLASIATVALIGCTPGTSAMPGIRTGQDAHDHAAQVQNTVQTVTLIGADGRQEVLTRQAVTALPRERVTFSRHEDTSVYEGPLLLDVLARVGVPPSPLRRDQQATALLITAADGYQVVLGLGEIDPATRADRIILADTDDGEPLGPDAGPFMIIAEGDARAARSARMVVSIRLVPLGESTH